MNNGFNGIYPLVNIQIAIGNGPVEIVDLPIKNGDFLNSKLLVYQRVPSCCFHLLFLFVRNLSGSVWPSLHVTALQFHQWPMRSCAGNSSHSARGDGSDRRSKHWTQRAWRGMTMTDVALVVPWFLEVFGGSCGYFKGSIGPSKLTWKEAYCKQCEVNPSVYILFLEWGWIPTYRNLPFKHAGRLPNLLTTSSSRWQAGSFKPQVLINSYQDM